MDANQEIWETLAARRRNEKMTEAEREAFNAAEQNADDTSVERGFEFFSAEWYQVFAMSYEFMSEQ